MAKDNSIHPPKFAGHPFRDALGSSPSVDEANPHFSHLDDPLRGQGLPNRGRVHIAPNGMNFFSPQPTEYRKFGDVAGVEDHLHVPKRPGQKIGQFLVGLA